MGRSKGNLTKLTVLIRKEQAEYLKRKENKSHFVRQAIDSWKRLIFDDSDISIKQFGKIVKEVYGAKDR